MIESCGNCKHMKCRPEYLYPYKCKYNKAVSYGLGEIERRVDVGYKCERYEYGIKEQNEGKSK